jgi:hypothetical protein
LEKEEVKLRLKSKSDSSHIAKENATSCELDAKVSEKISRMNGGNLGSKVAEKPCAFAK